MFNLMYINFEVKVIIYDSFFVNIVIISIRLLKLFE
jgi:hypothetical protein